MSKLVKTRSLFHSEEQIEAMILRYGAMFDIKPQTSLQHSEPAAAPVGAGTGFEAVRPACC
jgi:hypothetical protein